MGCCGGARASAWDPVRGRPAASRQGGIAERPDAFVVLENAGGQPLVAIGPVTGRRYRFHGPLARVTVDVRDAEALRRIPALRMVPRG
jgi:hypothetical protein